MNWNGFPVGFRFAANEINDSFKKKCWDIVLTSASYADLENMFLHEAIVEDPHAQMSIYIPIIGSTIVGPQQKNAEMWRRDTALLGHLTFYRPFVQENYLELFAPSHHIGSFLQDGNILADEGIDYLPDHTSKSHYIQKNSKAFFLSRIDTSENMDSNYSAAMDRLAAARPNIEIIRLNYTEGSRALYYASVFRKALLYWYSYKTAAGEKKQFQYALLPGGRCMIDGRPFFTIENGIDELNEFVKTISGWHGKGADVLVEEPLLETDTECTQMTDIKCFYGLEAAFEKTEKLFCSAQDTTYFTDKLQKTLIEI